MKARKHYDVQEMKTELKAIGFDTTDLIRRLEPDCNGCLVYLSLNEVEDEEGETYWADLVAALETIGVEGDMIKIYVWW